MTIFQAVLECQEPETTNEGESADFANFNPKIGCHGNVP